MNSNQAKPPKLRDHRLRLHRNRSLNTVSYLIPRKVQGKVQTEVKPPSSSCKQSLKNSGHLNPISALPVDLRYINWITFIPYSLTPIVRAKQKGCYTKKLTTITPNVMLHQICVILQIFLFFSCANENVNFDFCPQSLTTNF